MEYAEAKHKFIQAWGNLGSSWGINRTMAQIHALLLLSKKPLSTDDIMEELHISRGNTNMNIRALGDWGLVEKSLLPGDRKEYFSSDKDIMNLGVQVAKERKKRELEPILKLLNDVNSISGTNSDIQEFKSVTSDLLKFAKQSESILNIFISSNKNWFFKIISKLRG